MLMEFRNEWEIRIGRVLEKFTKLTLCLNVKEIPKTYAA